MHVLEVPATSTDEINMILNAHSALKRGDASVRLPSQ